MELTLKGYACIESYAAFEAVATPVVGYRHRFCGKVTGFMDFVPTGSICRGGVALSPDRGSDFTRTPSTRMPAFRADTN